MKRAIDHFLLEWKQRENKKPLLLRGARQVGKTHAVRTLGKTFEYAVVKPLIDAHEHMRNAFMYLVR